MKNINYVSFNILNFSGIYIHGDKTENNKKQLYTTSRKSAQVDPHAKEGTHIIGGL